MAGRRIIRYTIERRGTNAILMSWSGEMGVGPIELRQFGDIEAAMRAAEADIGSPLPWREARDTEVRHGVLVAADLT